MARSMDSYLTANDFEGAVERLNNTSARWKGEWFDVCTTIFNRCKEWAKTYVLDPINKAVRKLTSIKSIAPRTRKSNIDISSGCVIQSNEDKVQKCYLIEFFDANDDSICSKVGTTIRKIQDRIREELNSKTYQSMGAVRCVIHRVYDCGEIPAEGLESYFRAKYIRKYPNSFHKNDRFIKQVFDLVEADKICAEYLA